MITQTDYHPKNVNVDTDFWLLEADEKTFQIKKHQ